MSEKQPYGTVLIKADKILKFLSTQGQNQSLNTIASETGLTASTALKILDTLVLLNYVHKSQEHKTFKIGAAFVPYAQRYLENFDIVGISRPYLEELQKTFDETVHLGILEGNQVVYVNKIESQRAITLMSSQIGMKIPMYCSGMGKALLAEFNPLQLAQYFEQTELVPLTAHSMTNRLALKEELLRIKRDRVAFDNEERETDVFCVAAAIMNQNKIVGAFSISLPKYRTNPELIPHLVQSVLETKEKIEEAIKNYN